VFRFSTAGPSLPVGSRRSAGPTEISELGGVADLGDEPGLRPKINRGLLLDDSADWRRAKRYGVTSLCHGDVILSSVLAEEKPFFTLEQTRQVQAADRHVNLEFHLLFFLSFEF